MIRRRFLNMASAAACFTIANTKSGESSRKPDMIVPPEEAPHERTFMQWPASRAVYTDQTFLEVVQATVADIANAISDFEPVIVLAASEHHDRARRILSSVVELWDIPTEDLWCRDSGPLFAITAEGKRVVSHIRFNGWGRKQVHRHDGAVTEAVAERLGLPVVDSGLTGEAGGVDHDGHGLLIAHESSWLTSSRNPGLSRDDVEQRLLGAYGAGRLVWSPGVVGEDITDYHIDSLARFTGAGRVIINLPRQPDAQDPFHRAAEQTHAALIAAGLDVEVIPEPVNRRVKSVDFVASYANYYVCNKAVIAAQFGDRETDEIARDALARHYPGREIITLNVDALGEIGGGIHCATQQMPAT